MANNEQNRPPVTRCGRFTIIFHQFTTPSGMSLIYERICDRSYVRFLSWITTEVVNSAYNRSYDRSPFTTFRE